MCKVAARPMVVVVVVDAPRVIRLLGIVQADKSAFSKAFIARPPFELFRIRILHRFARIDEIHHKVVRVGTLIERFTSEFRSVIAHGRSRRAFPLPPARYVKTRTTAKGDIRIFSAIRSESFLKLHAKTRMLAAHRPLRNPHVVDQEMNCDARIPLRG